MKIHQLEVRNFRGFEHQTFHFSDQFTVLIGENGTGKTAIVDALVIGAGSLLLGFDGIHWGKDPGGRIQDNDIRQVRYKKGQAPPRQFLFPVEVSCQGRIRQRRLTWTASLERQAGAWSRTVTPEISDIAKQLQAKVHNGEDVLLPLIAYYGTGRLWVPQKGKLPEKPRLLMPRMRGYIDCLKPSSNLILEWFKTEEISVVQGQESIRIHEAVTDALSRCKIENWQSINYDEQEDSLLVTDSDGSTLPFLMLSAGVRNMVAMVADIAYRAAVLNPQLGSEAAQKTPGIVLIDEIDLHLHPKWQRRVIDDLKAAFPAIQFVATTHSPFIVQSLREGELINLDPQPPAEYHDRSIDDIAENVMGVEMPQKSERYLEMMEAAEEYYRVLQEAKDANPERIEELKARLDELTIPYSDDPAYQAFLKMEREAAGLGSTEK